MSYQRKLLFEIQDLLDKNGIEFFIHSGTLLGIYRDKNFIEWDKNDIDLGLLDKDYWTVRKIIEQSDWKIKAIWRREICIYKDLQDGKEQCHVDLFFYEEIDGNLCAYANERNPLSNFWEIPWQVMYPKDLILPLSKITFEGRNFCVPHDVEEYLTYHYGDWEIPDSNYCLAKRPHLVNKEYREIAIVITTVLRDSKLIQEIQSIINTFHPRWYRLYIGDQNTEYNTEKDTFYESLEQQGHKIFKLPYNCGISFSRNFLIKQTIEPFIIVIDDDYIFSKENSDLTPFIHLLLLNKNIGIVGGNLLDRSFYNPNYLWSLDLQKKINGAYLTYSPLHKNPYSISPNTLKQKSHEYLVSDSCLNFFMAKREVFDSIQWDENLKIVEHSDFLLRLKYDTKWTLLFTPEVKVSHSNEKDPQNYNNLRDVVNGINKDSAKNFYEKWNLTEDRIIRTSKNITISPQKKLNVCKIIDQFGWAYYFIAKEMQKYSSHNISYKKWNQTDLEDIDVLYISSPGINAPHDDIANHSLPLMAKAHKIKVIGGYSGEVNYVYDYADLICTISPQLYLYAMNHYKDIPIIFLPESVDTGFFHPDAFHRIRFKVGWAGGLNKQIKRHYLFDQFNYPVIKQSEWGKEYFVDNRTLDNMLNFYHSIDCFVLPSISECMPRVVMEAMACGLPVVACDVGSMRLLLEPEWIVPVYPEEVVVEEFNKKLTLLYKNPDLRKKVGERNRTFIQNYYSWTNNQILWDNVFNWLSNNNMESILKQNSKLIELFPKLYPELFPDSSKLLISKSASEKYNSIKDLLIALNKSNIRYWLLKESCLDCVINQKLTIAPHKLSIGVPDMDSLHGITKISNSFPQIEVEITIEKDRKTKPFMIYEIRTNVPMPVISYLESAFNKSFIELEKRYKCK